jgi:predicted nucleic acid-binding protein
MNWPTRWLTLSRSSRLLVADSGPLIALAKLRRLDLPAAIYPSVWVPATVLQECTRTGIFPDAMAIEAALSAGWLHACEDAPADGHPALLRLDAGERAAITLALQQEGADLLIDEAAGRQAARAVGLRVIGACGLLLRGKAMGRLPSVAPLIDELRRQGYFVSPALRAEVLRLAGE